MRFERRGVAAILKAFRPEVAGIACLHILDVPATLELARQVKAFDHAIFVAVGGHAASAYPAALDHNSALDAICIGEGEDVMAALCDAIEKRKALDEVPSLLLPRGNDGFRPSRAKEGWLDLPQVKPPDRSTVARYQKHYCCLNYMPVWTLETARGCPHRCKFCSVWQFYRRTYRCHAPAHVRQDFEAVGQHVFVIDDLFWAEKEQSQELAHALLASPERKRWILAQSRPDLVSENADLLELWRPLAKNFDIFFGFESPTRAGLDSLNKESDISKTVAAIKLARRLGFGVTGNFIIDPDFSEHDFAALWRFLDEHQLYRVGFTILTPLPGTYFFEQSEARLQVLDWNQYDLHHLLWTPRLPVKRFFELYSQTWQRTVLNTAGRKKWWRWLKDVDPRHLPRLARILMRTRRLMDPEAYLAETKIRDGATGFPAEETTRGAGAASVAAASQSSGTRETVPDAASGSTTGEG
jgi:radical SAM superfamily enzyme YgiQ (UPF0313 family)